jgi:hypothetical protein
MATSTVSRLAPVTARDGVDTRKKENCGTAEAVMQETTRLGENHVRIEQTAAMYLAPPGAEIVGSSMNAHWTNYLNLADLSVNDPEACKWVSYKYQQAVNEKHIERLCNNMGPNTEGMLNLYRELHNHDVTEFRRSGSSVWSESVAEYLAEYNDELSHQQYAAKLVQSWFRAAKIANDEIGCPECGESCRGLIGNQCSDCYWEEDSRMKRERRQAWNASIKQD